MTEHTLAADPTHSRWNRALPPRIEIDPGETVHCQCVEAAGAQSPAHSLISRTTTFRY
jgi:acetamidase/formamidase